jgi:hypothetical protein
LEQGQVQVPGLEGTTVGPRRRFGAHMSGDGSSDGESEEADLLVDSGMSDSGNAQEGSSTGMGALSPSRATATYALLALCSGPARGASASPAAGPSSQPPRPRFNIPKDHGKYTKSSPRLPFLPRSPSMLFVFLCNIVTGIGHVQGRSPRLRAPSNLDLMLGILHERSRNCSIRLLVEQFGNGSPL